MQSVLSIIAVLGIGSIVAALISWRVAIANHRQTWINGLRDDLAAFFKELEITHRFVDSLLGRSDQIAANIEHEKHKARGAILFAYWRIVFRLNRTEPMHTKLRQLLEDLLTIDEKSPNEGKVSEAVDLARQILKREWNVTKYGILTVPMLWFKTYWGSNSRSN